MSNHAVWRLAQVVLWASAVACLIAGAAGMFPDPAGTAALLLAAFGLILGCVCLSVASGMSRLPDIYREAYDASQRDLRAAEQQLHEANARLDRWSAFADED